MARKLDVPFTLEEAQEMYTEDWRRSSSEENILYGKLDAAGVEAQGRGLISVAWENIDPGERVIEVGEVLLLGHRLLGRIPALGQRESRISSRRRDRLNRYGNTRNTYPL